MIRIRPYSFPIFAAPILLLAGFCEARADVRTACAADVKSYCSGIAPKDGKLRDCMAESRAKLSNECKLAVADRLLERQAKRAAKKKSGSGLAPADKSDKSDKDDDD
jgi:hypothetical protein